MKVLNEFCTECGSKLVETNKQYPEFVGDKYDPMTGMKTTGLICPIMRRFLAIHERVFLSGIGRNVWWNNKHGGIGDYPSKHTRINC